MTTPLADPAVVDALAADLRSAGYTTAGVADLLGEQAEAAMDRGVWWPAERATRLRTRWDALWQRLRLTPPAGACAGIGLRPKTSQATGGFGAALLDAMKKR